MTLPGYASFLFLFYFISIRSFTDTGNGDWNSVAIRATAVTVTH